MIATTNEPKLTIGKTAVLEVTDVGRIGAFWIGDWKRTSASVQRTDGKSRKRRSMSR